LPRGNAGISSSLEPAKALPMSSPIMSRHQSPSPKFGRGTLGRGQEGSGVGLQRISRINDCAVDGEGDEVPLEKWR
ncbi:hypothetical protein, partial [Adonisia turfae]|uniref:hypothetical protein n=1 Tax=Adonisia turfae TaxID=2950184 RepID=UPI002029AD92